MAFVRSIVRGERVELGSLGVGSRCAVGLAVDAPKLTIDLTCFGLDAAGHLSDDRFFVFYNQVAAPGDAVRLVAGTDGDDARFELDLDAIPAQVERLVFVASIDGTGTMRLIGDGHLRLTSGAEVARFTFSGNDFAEERAVLVGELYRRGGWRFRAVGQGFNGGLDAVVVSFGGTVDDRPTPAPPPGAALSGRSAAVPPPRPTPAPARPSPSAPTGASGSQSGAGRSGAPRSAPPPSGPPGPFDLPVILTKFDAPADVERFSRPNPKLLRVRLGDPLIAAHGAMVAYQGFLDFAFQRTGGVGRQVAGRFTGEQLRLMHVQGQGDCYLAARARHVHILYLEGEALSVSAANVLAFDATIQHELALVKGVGMLGAGLATIVLSGFGWVALTTRGTPLVLPAGAWGTLVDPDAVVAWNTSLAVGAHRSFRLQVRGSGEVVQLAFRGEGFVIVQPSEL
jgi:stress response protein SCP2/uncharacterized protein (AIM24 family)